MAEQSPVRKGSIIWRRWWFAYVDTIGSPHMWGERWLSPVRYRNGDYGVISSMPRLKMNGIEVTDSSELHSDHECDEAIRKSTGMPEILMFTDERCCIGFTESGEDFKIEIVFLSDGAVRCARITAVAL